MFPHDSPSIERVSETKLSPRNPFCVGTLSMRLELRTDHRAIGTGGWLCRVRMHLIQKISRKEVLF
jgi:hypothetical protein